ncbi:MAG: hypothetical protein PWR03_1816 [Tenuifilum sp.]|uniref:nucleotidyltransferase family protein n=1 Tax=Tenuifilum sp. TaxID=2760880 RepID=UPI0024AAFC1B|nr:nucleotidyltransferase family protein [Tenuifilum sp.]MDI3527633.1 hypothetical protein [Tenuifilum sp.]
MKAMILAAGLGTRLLPLTETKPKALVEINGKTLLEICIDNLKKNGFNEVVVNVHHHAQQVIEFLSKRDFGVKLFISDESDRLLDTGGALVHARKFLDDNQPFLVHNVDIISDIDLKRLYTLHMDTSAIATLAVSKRESLRVFLFNNDMVLSGWRNMLTGKSIITRQENELVAYAFSGIHVISPEIFNFLPATGEFSIVDAYLKISTSSEIKGVDLSKNKVIDVGKPQSLEQAASFLS